MTRAAGPKRASRYSALVYIPARYMGSTTRCAATSQPATATASKVKPESATRSLESIAVARSESPDDPPGEASAGEEPVRGGARFPATQKAVDDDRSVEGDDDAPVEKRHPASRLAAWLNCRGGCCYMKAVLPLAMPWHGRVTR